MTPADLRTWQARQGLTQQAAANALGMSLSGYKKLVLGLTAADQRTALACAAVDAGMSPWGQQNIDKPIKNSV